MDRLQKWAHLAEIAGAIAVVISLVYVGYQINENTSAQQSQTELNLYSLTSDLDSWYQDSEFVAVVAKANRDFASLSEVERMQIEKHVLDGLNLWGYAWKSYGRGQIDEQEWQAWDRWFAGEMQNESWSSVYRKYSYGYHEDFQDHINDVSTAGAR